METKSKKRRTSGKNIETNLQVANPFRSREKKYKLFKNSNQETDFSDVIDFNNLSANSDDLQKKIHQVESPECDIFTVDGIEGLYFIRNPFKWTEHLEWMRECLVDYIKPPNKNNVTNLQGGGYDTSNNSNSNTIPTPSFDDEGKWLSDPSSSSFLRALRWITLGYQYDWTKRKYYKEDYCQFPLKLADLSSKFATVTGSKDFKAEAAIVNFYHTDSSLMAHLDNVEEIFDQPIVSISFGNTAVFLIGGETKDTEPTAMFVRSGDVVIMGGKSRYSYHGVPRIIANSVPKELSSLSETTDDCGRAVLQYIANARINVNVRQVFPVDSTIGESNLVEKNKDEQN